MKNFILTITRDTIPYVKELRPLAGSVAACIVMQQLDYWFKTYPDGFYKFLEPCQHQDYRKGDSFTEELAVSPDEFRTAFDKIGTRHTSKTAFLAAEDKFQGKFYCSYFDKKQGTTWYFRNHGVVDAALMALVSGSKERLSTVDGKRQLQGLGSPASVDGKRQLQKRAMPIPPISTETNTEINSKNNNNKAPIVVDFEKETLTRSNTQSEDEIAQLATALEQFRITPDGAQVIVRRHTDRARLCLDYWRANGDALSKARSIGAAVRSSIESPDKWPQIAAWRATPATTPATSSTRKPRAANPNLAAAAQRVFDSFPANYRKTVQKEKHDITKYVQQFHADELAAALRAK